MNKTALTENQESWRKWLGKFVEDDTQKIQKTKVNPRELGLSDYREEKLININQQFYDTTRYLINTNANEQLRNELIQLELVKRSLSIAQIYLQHDTPTLSNTPDLSMEAVKPLMESAISVLAIAGTTICNELHNLVDINEVEQLVKVGVMARRLMINGDLTEDLLQDAENLLKEVAGTLYTGSHTTKP